jgi:hypothetical protein
MIRWSALSVTADDKHFIDVGFAPTTGSNTAAAIAASATATATATSAATSAHRGESPGETVNDETAADADDNDANEHEWQAPAAAVDTASEDSALAALTRRKLTRYSPVHIGPVSCSCLTVADVLVFSMSTCYVVCVVCNPSWLCVHIMLHY